MSIGVETQQEHRHGIGLWDAGLLGASGVGIIRIAELVNPALSVRDKFPEPLDFMDHIGNPAAMAGIGFTVAHVYSGHREGKVVSEDDHRKYNRRFATIVGVGAVAANAYGELIGYGPTSTPDVIDFAYGLLAGIAIYKAGKLNFQPENSVNEQLDSFAEEVKELEENDADVCYDDEYFKRMDALSKARARMYRFLRYKKAIDKHKLEFAKVGLTFFLSNPS